jgi:hypothetical protein
LPENSSNGTSTGITAFASDGDGTTNSITYSLDDSAAGRFAVDSSTGVVTVADGSLLNYEAATSHSITIRATSTDGSFSTQSFTINLTDVDEFDVTPITDADSAANQVDENAANGTAVGITASASDADGTNNSVSYSLDDSAAGRFAIDSLTGIVSVANGNLLNREAAAAHNIVVRATSADGSFAQTNYTIQINDLDEFDANPLADLNPLSNSVAENQTAGTTVGITAWSSDSDSTNNQISYSLTDDDQGRFTIDLSTGVVSTTRSLDRELDGENHQVTVRATSSDGSFVEQTFTIALEDQDEFDVTSPSDLDLTDNSINENAAAGSLIGLTVQATDSDATANTINFSLVDDDGGRFAIDATTGTVTTTRPLDREVDGASRQITVRATSADGSTSDQNFTILLTDQDEFDALTPLDNDPTPNSVAENLAAGAAVGLTGYSSDADSTNNAIAYSLFDDDGGRFSIDSSSGAVTTTRPLDREADGASRQITIRASSSDGSFADETFLIAIEDLNESAVSTPVDFDGLANQVDENAAIGTTVGVTAWATDLDATQAQVSYQLLDDAGGRFAIDASTGVVTVAGPLDYETASQHSLLIRATSQDGSQSQLSLTVAVLPLNDNTPFFTSPPSYSVGEHEDAIGTLSSIDLDLPGQSLSYSISGGDDAAQFTLDPISGELRFTALQNHEAPADADADGVYLVRVRVTDGLLWSEQLLEITLGDENDAPLANQDDWAFDEDTSLDQTVVANDFDEDGNLLTVTLLDAPVHAANFTLNADGTFHYHPSADYFGHDSFRYRISDGQGGVADGQVNLTIQPVNDAPTSLSNVFTVLQGSTLESVTGVLFNDSDIDNDPLVAILTSPPTRGTLSFQTDGSFVYLPDRGFIGTDSFTYIASDGFTTGNPTTVQVVVDVAAAPPPPNGNGSSSSSSSTSSSSRDDEDNQLNTDDAADIVQQLPGQVPQTSTTSSLLSGTSGVSMAFSGQGNSANGQSSEDELSGMGTETGVGADPADVESQLLACAARIRDLIAAFDQDSSEGEVAKVKIKLGERTIEVNLGRRQLWEQLAYLQQQLATNANSSETKSLGEVSLELSAVTMAASLGYILWFLRGSAMMATVVTQVPAWKMIDPLVILDSFDREPGSGELEEDPLNSFFERPSRGSAR